MFPLTLLIAPFSDFTRDSAPGSLAQENRKRTVIGMSIIVDNRCIFGVMLNLPTSGFSGYWLYDNA